MITSVHCAQLIADPRTMSIMKIGLIYLLVQNPLPWENVGANHKLDQFTTFGVAGEGRLPSSLARYKHHLHLLLR